MCVVVVGGGGVHEWGERHVWEGGGGGKNKSPKPAFFIWEAEIHHSKLDHSSNWPKVSNLYSHLVKSNTKFLNWNTWKVRIIENVHERQMSSSFVPRHKETPKTTITTTKWVHNADKNITAQTLYQQLWMYTCNTNTWIKTGKLPMSFSW